MIQIFNNDKEKEIFFKAQLWSVLIMTQQLCGAPTSNNMELEMSEQVQRYLSNIGHVKNDCQHAQATQSTNFHLIVSLYEIIL